MSQEKPTNDPLGWIGAEPSAGKREPAAPAASAGAAESQAKLEALEKRMAEIEQALAELPRLQSRLSQLEAAANAAKSSASERSAAEDLVTGVEARVKELNHHMVNRLTELEEALKQIARKKGGFFGGMFGE